MKNIYIQMWRESKRKFFLLVDRWLRNKLGFCNQFGPLDTFINISLFYIKYIYIYIYKAFRRE